jgi:hypothetical protein
MYCVKAGSRDWPSPEWPKGKDVPPALRGSCGWVGLSAHSRVSDALLTWANNRLSSLGFLTTAKLYLYMKSANPMGGRRRRRGAGCRARARRNMPWRVRRGRWRRSRPATRPSPGTSCRAFAWATSPRLRRCEPAFRSRSSSMTTVGRCTLNQVDP